MILPNQPTLKATALVEVFAATKVPGERKFEVGEGRILMDGIGGLSRLVQVRDEQGNVIEERKFSPYQDQEEGVLGHDRLNRQMQQASLELFDKYQDADLKYFTYYGSETLEKLSADIIKPSLPYTARHVPILFDAVKRLCMASSVWWPERADSDPESPKKINDYRLYIDTDMPKYPLGPDIFRVFGVGHGNPERGDWLDYRITAAAACDVFDKHYFQGVSIEKSYDAAKKATEQKIRGLGHVYR